MSTPPTRSSIDAIADAVGAERLDFAGQSSPDGAITLLLAEIVAATPGGQDEPAAAQARRDSVSILHALVGSHGGTVVKSEGDGFMASFPSTHAGLRCAIDMQRALADRPAPAAEGGLALRIGLHAGFVLSDETQFFGRNVVLAARIADHARGGEILVSSTMRQYTASDPSFRFEGRGEVYFKGVLGEHEIYAVQWAGDGGGAPPSAAGA